MLVLSTPWSSIVGDFSKIGVYLQQQQGPWADLAVRLKQKLFEESMQTTLTVLLSVRPCQLCKSIHITARMFCPICCLHLLPPCKVL